MYACALSSHILYVIPPISVVHSWPCGVDLRALLDKSVRTPQSWFKCVSYHYENTCGLLIWLYTGIRSLRGYSSFLPPKRTEMEHLATGFLKSELVSGIFFFFWQLSVFLWAGSLNSTLFRYLWETFKLFKLWHLKEDGSWPPWQIGFFHCSNFTILKFCCGYIPDRKEP